MPGPHADLRTRRVGVSLGNLERFVDGLGEFSQQLGLALAARAPMLRESHQVELHFHVVPALLGCFGPEVAYLPVRRLQEWVHRQPVAFEVWHTLNQLNRYPAPWGTARTILTLHDLNYVHLKRGYSRWRDHRRLRRRLDRTDHVVTISQHVAGDLRQHTDWRGPVQTIYNGVRDLRSVTPRAVDDLVGQRFLFHISRLTPSKNVESLLAMMAVWPEHQLVLAGPSAARNAELLGQAGRLGLRNVRILTLVDDAQKAWLYANCDAFLFPSLAEGFGLPPLEAMHFGKPVILSDRSCLPEIGGDAASYWHSFEAHSMRAVVESTLLGFGPAQADKARARASSFTWEAAADAHVDCYLEQLAHAAARKEPGP